MVEKNLKSALNRKSSKGNPHDSSHTLGKEMLLRKEHGWMQVWARSAWKKVLFGSLRGLSESRRSTSC